MSVCGLTTPKESFTLRQIIPSGNVLICHKIKLSARFTSLTIKRCSFQFYECRTIHKRKYRHFMSLCICHPFPNAGVISPTMQFFLFFLASFIYFANMLTPDTIEQNLLAAPLSATTNTQLLVCKSNAEQKIIFTCVITITQLQNICD